jgi:hypothetical protein
MIPASRLSRANNQKEAQAHFGRYDIVPCPLEGPIDGFFAKTDGRQYAIGKGDLVGGGTSLLNLLQLFDGRDFYFVLHANKIAGFINVSDLNHNYIRIPLFGLLQLLEQKVWEDIKERITEEIVESIFPKDYKSIMKSKREKEQENLDLGWTGVFYIAQIMKLAVHFKQAKLEDDEIDKLNDVRNAVAHPHGELIKKREDLRTIAQVCELSRSLLSSA